MEPKVDRIFSSADAAEEGEMVNMEGPADIIVYLDNGEKFISSFFTCAGIQKMQKEHQEYRGIFRRDLLLDQTHDNCKRL